MSAELLLCCLTLKVPKTCLWAGIEVLTRDSFPHQLVLTMLRALRLTMAVPVWEEKAKGISAEQQLPAAQKRPMEEMAVPCGHNAEQIPACSRDVGQRVTVKNWQIMKRYWLTTAFILLVLFRGEEVEEGGWVGKVFLFFHLFVFHCSRRLVIGCKFH